MAVAAGVERHVELRLLHGGFGQGRLGALVEHSDDKADHLEIAQFLGGDIEQHFRAARIVLGEALREIAHRGGELAIGPAELLEQQRGQRRVRLGDADGVLQALAVHEHGRRTP